MKNIFLLIIMLIVAGFYIYLFIDTCIQRKQLKRMWITLTLVGGFAGVWTLHILLSLPFSEGLVFVLTQSRLSIRLFRVFLLVLAGFTDYVGVYHFWTDSVVSVFSFGKSYVYRYQCWIAFRGGMIFLIIPRIMFLMMETLLVNPYWELNVEYFVMNLMFYTFIMMLVYVISRDYVLFIIVPSFFVLIVGIINYFVYVYRGRYLSPNDLYEAETAAGVVGKYQLTLSGVLILGIVYFTIIVMLSVLLERFNQSFRREPRWLLKKQKSRTYRGRIPLTAMLVCFLLLCIKTNLVWGQIKSIPWSPIAYENKYGFPVAFAAQWRESIVKQPEEYSVGEVEQILTNNIPEQEFESTKREPADIIMIMNESLADLSVMGEFETDQPIMPYVDGLKENVFKGYLEVSGIGGGTSYTEFESLSGCTERFIEGSAYAKYIKSDIPTLVSLLERQEKQYSTRAIHPEDKTNYARDRVYEFMGFDEMFFYDYFTEAPKIFTKVTDLADFQFIIEQYENRDIEKPFFAFNVTMQNHGGYNYEGECSNPVHITSFDNSDVDQYLSLVKMTDTAFQELINYFEAVETPTIVVMFGDHQPLLDDEFYEQLVGKKYADFSEQEIFNAHLTPVIIWANYDIPEEDLGIISPNYLSPIILKTAGLEMTPYNNFVYQMMEELPVIQTTGCMDAEGNLYTDEIPEKYQEMLKEYEMVQYNYLHDNENRLNKYY